MPCATVLIAVPNDSITVPTPSNADLIPFPSPSNTLLIASPRLVIIPFAPSHTEEITFEIPSNAELIICAALDVFCAVCILAFPISDTPLEEGLEVGVPSFPPMPFILLTID